jgi:hypothetical protein
LEQLVEDVRTVFGVFLLKELTFPDHALEGSHSIISIHLIEPIMIELEPVLKLQFQLIINFLKILLIKQGYFGEQDLINGPDLNNLTAVNNPVEYSFQVLQ